MSKLIVSSPLSEPANAGEGTHLRSLGWTAASAGSISRLFGLGFSSAGGAVTACGLWRDVKRSLRGGRERHSLRSPLNHVGRLALGQERPQRLKRSIEFVVGHRLDDVARVFELHLLGNQ